MKVIFHDYRRWCAVSLDGEPMGYMSHFGTETTLHLKKDAPKWLRDVRDCGPFLSNQACQIVIKHAVSTLPPELPLGANVLQFPQVVRP